MNAPSLGGLTYVNAVRACPPIDCGGLQNMTIYAGSIMTRTVIAAGPDDTVSKIAALFTKHGISAVPVCDKDGTMLGIISEGDLMRPFGEANKLHRDWWLGLLADGEELAPEFLDYLRADHRRAHDLMTKDVITATEDTHVGKIADLLQRHRIKRVPILRDGKVVGIVSRADLIHALAKMPQAMTDTD
jgi:CBS domain-containing protein